jgi:7-carboxy-7-deazaguanine synthase
VRLHLELGRNGPSPTGLVMTYSVKEIFYTLQGEGANTGRAAVFCRFSGCNLWSGLEKDRSSAVCQFCDTDFVGTNGENGGKYRTVQDLVAVIDSLWPTNTTNRFIVCTGGEPLLQLDTTLINCLHDFGFEIAIETNGTIPAPKNIDWICVSPKADAELKQRHGDELKLVYPQEKAMPEKFQELEFTHRYLQPMDNPEYEKNLAKTLAYCQASPEWKLSLQTHKILNIQ